MNFRESVCERERHKGGGRREFARVGRENPTKPRTTQRPVRSKEMLRAGATVFSINEHSSRYQYQKVSPDSMHINHIIQTDTVIFTNICVIYACIISI